MNSYCYKCKRFCDFSHQMKLLVNLEKALVFS